MTQLQDVFITRPKKRQPAASAVSLEGRRWLKATEAAEYLSVHLITIYAWIDEGRLPAGRIGRAIRIDKRRLDEMLESDLRAAPVAARGKGERG